MPNIKEDFNCSKNTVNLVPFIFPGYLAWAECFAYVMLWFSALCLTDPSI